MKTKEKKVIYFLNRLLLIDISVFILFCPFFGKVPKITAVIGFILWISLNLIKFDKSFYKNLIPKNSLNKPILLFSLALVFSVIFSLDFYHSQSILFERYLYYFFFFIIGSYLGQNKKNLFFLVAVIILTGIVVGIGGVWDLIRFQPKRLFTFYGQDIIFGPFLTLVLPFLFIITFFLKKRIIKICATFSFLLLFIILIANASRATWVGVFFAMLLASFIRNKKITIILIVIFIVGGFTFLSSYLQERVVTLITPFESMGDRISMWKSTISMWEDFPIFGVGLGMYEQLVHGYVPFGGGWKLDYSHAHSTYFELLAEVGIMGLITFLLLFVLYFRNFSNFYKKSLDNKLKTISLGFAAAVLASLIAGLSGSLVIVGIQTASLFWLFFGLAVGLGGKDAV